MARTRIEDHPVPSGYTPTTSLRNLVYDWKIHGYARRALNRAATASYLTLADLAAAGPSVLNTPVAGRAYRRQHYTGLAVVEYIRQFLAANGCDVTAWARAPKGEHPMSTNEHGDRAKGVVWTVTLTGHDWRVSQDGLDAVLAQVVRDNSTAGAVVKVTQGDV